MFRYSTSFTGASLINHVILFFIHPFANINHEDFAGAGRRCHRPAYSGRGRAGHLQRRHTELHQHLQRPVRPADQNQPLRHRMRELLLPPSANRPGKKYIMGHILIFRADGRGHADRRGCQPHLQGPADRLRINIRRAMRMQQIGQDPLPRLAIF